MFEGKIFLVIFSKNSSLEVDKILHPGVGMQLLNRSHKITTPLHPFAMTLMLKQFCHSDIFKQIYVYSSV